MNSHSDRHPSSHLSDPWFESTRPCPIITWDGLVIIGEHLHVDRIYYTTYVWPFDLLCSEAISAYARLVKFNPSILHVQNWLAPVVCERRAYHTRSSCGVSARWTVATVHTQGEPLYLEISERSSHNATIELSKIRCKIKINITCNQYKWYDMAIIILCLWSPSPKHRHDHQMSPARHLDLHRSIIVVSPTVASTTIATA